MRMSESTATESRKHPGGRRKGSTNTRDAILHAAVKLFAESGYEGASLRAITKAAGVDVALVRHFFGDKQGLFEEAILKQGYDNLKLLMDADYQGSPARRVLEAYFAMWENEETSLTTRALFRTALESEENRNKLVELIGNLMNNSLHKLASSKGITEWPEDDVTIRTQLIASQLLGIGVTRYVLKLKPIADVPSAQLINQLEPVLNTYVRRELDIPNPQD
jgi:AcrR family transcriptional regulator